MSAKVLGLDLISDVLKKINSKEACEGGIKGAWGERAGRQKGTKLEHSVQAMLRSTGNRGNF